MVHTRLTTAQAAERLGVKPATLYSYVSRGLLQRQRTAAGSTFDAQEVARLARSARHPGQAGTPSSRRSAEPDDDRFNQPVFVTELTLIEGGRLYYRGLDAVALSRSRTFEEVAGWLWTGAWPERLERWSTPAAASAAIAASAAHLDRSTLPIERFMLAVVVAALGDDLRHDLSPPSVTMVGRHLLSTLVDVLPAIPAARLRMGWPAGGSISERLWPRLSRLAPTPARVRVLETALVLAADHELAPSTLAVRVAAALASRPLRGGDDRARTRQRQLVQRQQRCPHRSGATPGRGGVEGRRARHRREVAADRYHAPRLRHAALPRRRSARGRTAGPDQRYRWEPGPPRRGRSGSATGTGPGLPAPER